MTQSGFKNLVSHSDFSVFLQHTVVFFFLINFPSFCELTPVSSGILICCWKTTINLVTVSKCWMFHSSRIPIIQAALVNFTDRLNMLFLPFLLAKYLRCMSY